MVLFAAFVFFVVAKGAVARSGAQSAADAAALAAAQEVRDELTLAFIDGLKDGSWEDVLEGEVQPGEDGWVAAQGLAEANDAILLGLDQTFIEGHLAFEAHVETNYTVGDSLVPGTEHTHATADATAVIEPRCEIAGDDPEETVEFTCEGSGEWVIDPKEFENGDLPMAKDLFEVNLAE